MIPVGRIIYLDENVEDLIHDIDNVSHTWDRDMLRKKWIMKEEGLTCLDCAEIEGANSEDFEEGDWN